MPIFKKKREKRLQDTALKKGNISFRKELGGLLFEVGLIVTIILLLFTFVFGALRYSQRDMFPSVKDGDLVIFYRMGTNYAIKDLVVLTYEDTKQVRRVEGLAGDKIDIVNGRLIRNGIPQSEENIGIYEETEMYKEGVTFPLTVPEGQIFVLADSRNNSTDSRIYGCVDIKDTYGTVIMIGRRRGF